MILSIKNLLTELISFWKAARKDRERSGCKDAGYLLDYTVFHFEAEEKLQEEIQYPGIQEHKAKHADLNRL